MGGRTTKFFWPFKKKVIVNTNWRTPKLLERLKCKSESGNNGKMNWGRLLNLQHSRGKRACKSSRLGT
jgi:hypothetical protein